MSQGFVVLSLARLQSFLHYFDGGFEAKRPQIRGIRSVDDTFRYSHLGIVESGDSGNGRLAVKAF